MKVICPKCQFENQADSSRVVCGRCATIIQVKIDPNPGAGEQKRQTARLPFSNGNGNSGPLSYPTTPVASNPLTTPARDAYATRLGEEFDNVLDLPGPAPTNYQTSVEPAPVFDDVFAAPPTPTSYDTATNYNFAAYDKRPTAPVENAPAATSSQRVTQDYPPVASEQEFMGWPMLPENSLEDDDDAGGFASNRGGVLARVALIMVAFGALSFMAYYFLWDYIAKRKEPAPNPTTGQVEDRAAQTAGANASRNSPPVRPQTVATPPLITPKPQETSAATTNPPAKMQEVKPALPEKLSGPDGHSRTAKPAPTPIAQVAPAKPAPTPVPAAPAGAKAPSRGNLTIQVGSFSDRAQAEARAAAIGDARVVTANIPGKGTWYRVQVGGFESREAANSFAGKLRAQGKIQDFIVTSK